MDPQEVMIELFQQGVRDGFVEFDRKIGREEGSRLCEEIEKVISFGKQKIIFQSGDYRITAEENRVVLIKKTR